MLQLPRVVNLYTLHLPPPGGHILQGVVQNRFYILKHWPAKLVQSVARLTLVQKVASWSPTAGRLTQPAIPPWVSEMSTW